MPKQGLSKDVETKFKFIAFAPYTSLLKSKKRSSASLPASLYAWLLEKNIFWLFCINWQSFIVWLALLREILGNIVIIY